nr:hypothetical protein CFP56_46164 [Quercus suber]
MPVPLFIANQIRYHPCQIHYHQSKKTSHSNNIFTKRNYRNKQNLSIMDLSTNTWFKPKQKTDPNQKTSNYFPCFSTRCNSQNYTKADRSSLRS